MTETTNKRKGVWFWVGFVLLSLNALLWLALIGSILEGEVINMGETILGGVFISLLPVGLGVFGIWYGANAAPRWNILGPIVLPVLVLVPLIIFINIPESAKEPLMWGLAIGVPVAMFGVPLVILYLAQSTRGKR